MTTERRPMTKIKNVDGQFVMLFEFDNDFVEVLEEQFNTVKRQIIMYSVMLNKPIDEFIFTLDNLLSLRDLQWHFPNDHPQIDVSLSIVRYYKNYRKTKMILTHRDMSGWIKMSEYFFEQERLKAVMQIPTSVANLNADNQTSENESKLTVTSSGLKRKHAEESDVNNKNNKYGLYNPDPKTQHTEYSTLLAYGITKEEPID